MDIKVKGIYIDFRMCVCEGGHPTNNRCPYRCLSALICHVLSATIHPDLKRTLVAMSERKGMSVSQVTDEVLYTGLVEMQELPNL